MLCILFVCLFLVCLSVCLSVCLFVFLNNVSVLRGISGGISQHEQQQRPGEEHVRRRTI